MENGLNTEKQLITVETTINAPVERVWECYTSPVHIVRWNFASPEWHSPTAENDLRPGGRFVYRMEAKDGSVGFDFGGTFDEVKPNEYLAYTIEDNRKVQLSFNAEGDGTKVTETFEAEITNSPELQKRGWQAILDNFKSYTEEILRPAR